jgi:hypothetical protein
LISPETSVESSDGSVDFSERNASVAKTRNFELLCITPNLNFFENLNLSASQPINSFELYERPYQHAGHMKGWSTGSFTPLMVDNIQDGYQFAVGYRLGRTKLKEIELT